MRKRLILIVSALFLLAINIFAEDPKEIENRFNSAVDSVKSQHYDKNAIDSINQLVETVFKWKVQENENGYMLTLDHPYENILDPIDYASLTVLKKKGKDRFYLFSIALGSMIDFDKNISLSFGRYRVDGTKKIDISEESYRNIPFSKKEPDYIKVTFPEFYIDKEKTQDLFEAMTTNDFMFIEIFGTDGKKYSIGIPLIFFREAIAGLK